jgi:transcription antitermination factor NusG
MRPEVFIDRKNWFAVQVKPRLERAVAQLLRGKGYQQFLPFHLLRHKWPDRIKHIETPCPIPDEEIDAMQTIVNSGSELQKWDYVDVGQRITVDGGPLRGLEGIIVAVKDEVRLVVSVTLLRQSIAVELRPEWISRRSVL